MRRSAAPAEITFKSIGRGRLSALIRERSAEFARLREAKIAEEREAATAGAPTAPAQTTSVQTEMMADLSHEMKTPLNAIMGFSDAMRAETFGELGHDKYKEYAEDIHAAGAHLIDLISALSDAAKVEAGRYTLSPTLMAPGPILMECAAMIRGEAEKAGLKLVIDIAPDLPEAMLDARAIKQILINLMSNAVKFTAEGEIVLSVHEKCGALDFVVSDTGVGMNPVMLAKLGGRYSDAQKNGVRGAKGTGLGLSLAMSLAKLHGGALKIQSAEGEGTTARLTLPVRRTLEDFTPEAGQSVSAPDIQSQFDRVNAFRREREASAA